MSLLYILFNKTTLHFVMSRSLVGLAPHTYASTCPSQQNASMLMGATAKWKSPQSSTYTPPKDTKVTFMELPKAVSYPPFVPTPMVSYSSEKYPLPSVYVHPFSKPPIDFSSPSFHTPYTTTQQSMSSLMPKLSPSLTPINLSLKY